MTWMNEKFCPVCGAGGFDPDRDEVDVGVGAIEGNRRGVCRHCGEVFEDGERNAGWVAQYPPPSVKETAVGRKVAAARGVGRPFRTVLAAADEAVEYLRALSARRLVSSDRERPDASDPLRCFGLVLVRENREPWTYGEVRELLRKDLR